MPNNSETDRGDALRCWYASSLLVRTTFRSLAFAFRAMCVVVEGGLRRSLESRVWDTSGTHVVMPAN
jgi:hypothetical protein